MDKGFAKPLGLIVFFIKKRKIVCKSDGLLLICRRKGYSSWKRPFEKI